MSVYKTDRSPYWQYDFQHKKRRFHGSTGCTSRRDAERYERSIRSSLADGAGQKPAITLDAATDAYWLDKGQHERASATTAYQLENLCRIIGPNKVLSDIASPDVRKFIARRRADEVSNASINREVQLARRVWKHAAPTYATSVIAWGDLLLDEPPERVRELSADEEKRLFDALPESLKPIVEFAILSGQRKSAIVGLRWDRINWAAGEARIEAKGGGEHTFPITPLLALLIREQPVVQGCPFVFTYKCERHSPARHDRPRRIKGERYPFSKQGWDRAWRKAVADAGLGDFRFHDLRHTTATRLMRATGNIKAASRLLGHTDIRTTARYAHVQMDDLRSLMSGAESRNNTGARLTIEPETGRILPETEV